MKKLFLLYLLMLIEIAWAEQPRIIWYSTPVKPGETVMLFGGGWGKHPQIKLANGTTVQPLKITNRTLFFLYPKNMAMGIVRGSVITDNSSSGQFELNRPDAWWLQGDNGKQASCGGRLRIFGRCLSFNSKAMVKINDIELKPAEQDCWSLNIAIPKYITPGEYRVKIDNGLGVYYPAGMIRITPPQKFWEKQIFDVTDYGAVPNDGFSDTVAIQTALQAVKKNHGGILYFPRGRYQINKTINIPPYTLLKGESCELSQIYWVDTDNPPDTLLNVAGNCGIKELTIVGGMHRDGITVKGDNVILHRLRVSLAYTQYLTPEERIRRRKILAHKHILVLNGNNIKTTDSDFAAVKCGAFLIHGNNITIENNTFNCNGGSGFAGSRMIFNRNRILNIEGISFGQVNAEGSQNIYWGNNYQQENLFWDRESMTCDGGVPSYKDTPKAVNGNELVLKSPIWRFGAKFWKNGYVQLIAGKGAGQIRKIAKIDGAKVVVAKPWTIQPNEKTFVVISALRRHFIYVKNRVNDSTVALQLYGSMIESIIADNQSSRSGGFHNFGMTKGGSPEVNWFIQYFDNQILEGNAYRGPMNEMPPLDAHIAIRDRGLPRSIGKFSLTRACLMRRNILHSNAHLEVLGDADGVLIENCLVKNADNGIHIQRRSRNVVLRGNRFENVKQPYICSDTNTLLSQKEKIAGAIEGAAAMLGKNCPPQWKALQTKLDNGAVPREILKQALTALSRQQKGKAVDGKVMEVLLGLKINTPNWRTVADVFQGRGSVGRLLMTSPATYLPVKVTITPEKIAGWDIKSDPMSCWPGSGGRAFLKITKPIGKITVFMLKLHCTAQGEGWNIAYNTRIDNGRYSYQINDFLVAGPFENKSGKAIDSTVHPPEISLNVSRSYHTPTGRSDWRVVQANHGVLNFKTIFKRKTLSVAFAVAVIRATHPIMIRLRYENKNTLCRVNGKNIGTAMNHGQWGCVQLKTGDNVVMLISTSGQNSRASWLSKVEFDVQGNIKPGDLNIVPAEELHKLKILNAGGTVTSKSGKLPNGMNLKWRQLYYDNFNRERLGSYITPIFTVPEYIKKEAFIKNGALHCSGARAIYKINDKFKLPLRVEYDFYQSSPRKTFGLFLGQAKKSKYMFDKKLRYGYYYSPVGIGNNSFSRNDKIIFTGHQSIYTKVKANKWHHVVFQIVPPHCQLYCDGQLEYDFKDREFLKGLEEIALWSEPGVAIDNLCIYTVNTK